MNQDQLQRIARLLDVAFDRLEERDGLAVHPAYRALARAVGAWDSAPVLGAARQAAVLASKGRVPETWDVDLAAVYLGVVAHRYAASGTFSRYMLLVLRDHVRKVACRAFGEQGDALVREAWEGP